MAELAAKIRAKFRRRHSAIPSAIGIPSVLSSTSVRSTGSQHSSIFRPTAFRSRSHNAEHIADNDAKSPTWNSRVSVTDLNGQLQQQQQQQQQQQLQLQLQQQQHPQPQPGSGPDGGETTAGHQGDGEGQGEQAAAALVGQEAEEGGQAEASLGQHDDSSHHHLSDNNPPQSLAQGDANLLPGLSSSSSSSSSLPEPSHVAAPITAAPASPVSPAPASPTMRALQALPMPLESTTDSAAISPLASAAADGAARATEDSSPPAAPGRLTASAMEKSGSDLHSQSSTQHLRQLSCISEHPSPDQPQTTQPTAAPPPPSTKVVLPTDATSTHARKIDDAADAKPPSVVPLPTPKLGPGLAATTTQRPFHIPISTLSPSAALVSPSAANLSPNVAYTSTGTTAPSSPLARNSSTASNSASRPTGPIRRQSLISNRQSTLIQTLLRGSQADDAGGNSDQLLPISGNMVTRKIWVKRPNASATLVTINEDDLVDDVRDMILRKYANSLGRQFDAPDLTIRIRPTGNLQDRMLGPEEPMSRTLDAYYPGGQTVDDALIIDVPQRRTPRASPRAGPPHAPHMQYYEDTRPSEAGNDYFGPGALTAHVPVTVTAPSNGSAPAHAISILQTGHLPQLPSPGGTRSRNYRERPERPRLGRQHTSSPTLINMASGAPHQGSMAAAAAPHGTQIMHPLFSGRPRSRTHSNASDQPQATTAPPPMSTPPAPESTAIPQRVATPPPRVSSPRPKAQKKSKKNTDHPSLPKGMLNGSVPPINVLIVEDNIINLKLLEAFVKRLKVRWQTAMNGRDAVTKWRGGGFHLVLMDIQLPVMSGLDATREIRRLERVNSIGVFSSAANAAPEVKAEPAEKDKLENMHLFRSPVIIVALTASSLQSDRHEALAAGCNDFLTKPVNFVWLERKVMEWGCMQALIDFDGWRKWKDFSQKLEDDKKTAAAVSAQKARTKKNRSSLTQAVTAGA